MLKKTSRCRRIPIGGEQNKAKKADDQDEATPDEKEGSDVDDEQPDEEGRKDNPDQQDDAVDAEEDGNESEAPLQDNTVPMMDHFDNSQVLDLPEDLELDDHGSDGGDNSAQDSIMDLDDSAPEPPHERQETELDEVGKK